MKKHQKTKLSKLLRELVLRRDKCCLRCGKTTALHTSHIYPRGKYPKMQFEPLNVKALCVGCHLYWWHKHPIEAKEWAEKALGRTRLMKLKRRANTIDKSLWDYEQIKQQLKEEIENYG
tara:strand:+ start:183 stop:539 length:357 start_codon:yes stop_codon:yes gene_type:complete